MFFFFFFSSSIERGGSIFSGLGCLSCLREWKIIENKVFLVILPAVVWFSVMCCRGAENKICTNVSGGALKVVHFGNIFWHGRFRTISQEEMGNFEKFSDVPVFFGLRQVWPKIVFLVVILFVFGLACCTSWWRLYQNNQEETKKWQSKRTPINESNSWSLYFSVFFLLCCVKAHRSAVLIYISMLIALCSSSSSS